MTTRGGGDSCTNVLNMRSPRVQNRVIEECSRRQQRRCFPGTSSWARRRRLRCQITLIWLLRSGDELVALQRSLNVKMLSLPNMTRTRQLFVH